MINEHPVKLNRKFGERTTPMYQWDIGQKLVFETENDIDGTEVQFSDGSVKVVFEKSVEIPDKLLQTPGTKNCWVQIIGKRHETTLYPIGFEVLKRAKKNDYVEPDDEESFREQISGIVENAVSTANSVSEKLDEVNSKIAKVDEKLEIAEENIHESSENAKKSEESANASKEYSESSLASAESSLSHELNAKGYSDIAKENAEIAGNNAATANAYLEESKRYSEISLEYSDMSAENFRKAEAESEKSKVEADRAKVEADKARAEYDKASGEVVKAIEEVAKAKEEADRVVQYSGKIEEHVGKAKEYADKAVASEAEIRGIVNNIPTKEQISEVVDSLEKKQDKLTPGANIKIENNVISSAVDTDAIPKKVSQLENDENYAKKSEIESLIPDYIATNEFVESKISGYRRKTEQDEIDSRKVDKSQYEEFVSQTNSSIEDKVSDVTINGASIVTDGVAGIPLGKNDNKTFGAVASNSSHYGVLVADGLIKVAAASDAEISGRKGSSATRLRYAPIVLNTLDFAVKAAMCDGHGADWTPEEQTAAQQRIGIITLTQEEYDLLEAPSESTIYIIVEAAT